MSDTIAAEILALVRQKGIVRPRDLPSSNPTVYLNRLVARGELQKLDRGLYAPVDLELTLSHSFAENCKRLPSGVICLLSALTFHQFTTQNPSDIWMAFRSNFTPATHDFPIRATRMTGASWEYGIEEHEAEGVKFRVYSPAKTVADCFKFRNKVGLDVAMEALREGWRDRLFTMDHLWWASRACRVERVMTPYIEMMLA
jgi:predicted transcriptional regulator of viral defense system